MADIMMNATILEICDDQSINVPISETINKDIVVGDDPSPMFVNVEVARTTKSEGNNRIYHNSNMQELAKLIVGAQGFLGHPDPTKASFEFRQPHNVYVGAMVQEISGGGSRVIGKTYIFKDSPLREYLPKTMACGNPLTVSINAIGDVKPLGNGDLDVMRITELRSVDWANPGTQGIGTASALSIVTEMGGKHNMADDVKTTIAGIGLTELRAYNPVLISDALKGVSLMELQNANPTLVEQIKESAKITEIGVKIGGKDEKVKLSDLQGKIDNFEVSITELQNKITEGEITATKQSLLLEMVQEDLREKISPRVVGETKEEIKNSITSELAYIQEMSGVHNNPKGNTANNHSDDDDKSGIMSLFGIKKTKPDEK